MGEYEPPVQQPGDCGRQWQGALEQAFVDGQRDLYDPTTDTIYLATGGRE